MKVDYHFKNLQHSKALVSHCEEQLSHVEHFIHHNMRVQVFFSNEGFEKCVDVHIKTLQQEHKATASAETFLLAIDGAFTKVQRQLLKTKEKTKHRKGREKARDVYLSGRQDEEAA